MAKIATVQTDSGIKSAACIQLHFELYWFWNLFAGRLLALLLRLPFPQCSCTEAQRSVFGASGGYALGCVLKTSQTADTGVTVRGLHFVVRLF